jgi:hypothetical protein
MTGDRLAEDVGISIIKIAEVSQTTLVHTPDKEMTFSSSTDSDHVIENTEHSKLNTAITTVDRHIDTDVESQFIIDYRAILNANIAVHDLVADLSSDASLGASEYRETDMSFSRDVDTIYAVNNGLDESVDIANTAGVNASLASSLYSTGVSVATNASINAIEHREPDMLHSNDVNAFYIANSELKESVDTATIAGVNASLASGLYSTAMSATTTDVNPVTAPVDTGFTLLFPRPLTESQLAVLKSL